MTNEQLLRYFENRPSLKEIHLVGSVVFVDEPAAKKYSAQIKALVVTKHKKELQDAYEKEMLDLKNLTKEEAQAQLKDLDLTASIDDSKLQILVEVLGLTPEEKTRSGHYKALLSAQSELQGNDDDNSPEIDEETGTGDQDAGDGDNKKELTKEEAEKLVVKSEWNDKSDYYLAQDLVRILELPVEGKSKDVYVTALLNFKADNSK